MVKTKMFLKHGHWLHLQVLLLIVPAIFIFTASSQSDYQVVSAANDNPVGHYTNNKGPTGNQAISPPTVPSVNNQVNAAATPSTPDHQSTSVSQRTSVTSSSARPSPTSASTLTPAAPPPVTPSGDIASEATCPGQTSIAATTTVLVCLTSYARTQHGLATVHSNVALMAAAAAKAQDIINCGFSHTACGRPFNYWFGVKGYTGNCQAENIAEGQQTPIAVFTAWMNSAGHRANILGINYRDIGVAEANSSQGPVWIMELGGC